MRLKSYLLLVAFLLLQVISPGIVSACNDDLSLWSYNKRIYINTTFQGAAISTNLRDFPVLISLTDENFKFSQAAGDGSDIRFAKKNGVHVPYEIEMWDYSKKQAKIWVKMDTIYGNQNSQFVVMYWGKEMAVSASSPTEVFVTNSQTAGFSGVWHFHEHTPLLYPDASGNREAEPYWSQQIDRALTGVIADGVYPRVSEYLEVDNGPPINITGNLTLSTWIKGPATSNGVIASKYMPTTTHEAESFKLTFSSGAFPKLNMIASNTGAGEGVVSAPFPADTLWHYVCGVYDAVASKLIVYIDGNRMADTSFTGGIRSTSSPLIISAQRGENFTPTNSLNRPIDEMRIARVANSADWIRLCYENQKLGESLLCFDAPCSRVRIIMQPADISVYVEKSAQFAVEASGDNLTYQWYKDGDVLIGDTTAILDLIRVSMADSGSLYSCIVTGNGGQETTRNAELTVRTCDSPSITSQPQSTILPEGASATVTVSASGLGLKYQWKRNDVDIIGATGSSFTLPSVKSINNGDLFTVLVRNGCDQYVLSNSAKLTISGSLFCGILSNPQNDTVEVGDPFITSVSVSCDQPRYQWNKNGIPISGASEALLISMPLTLADNGAKFVCIINNGTVFDTSAPATVTVIPPKNGNRLIAISGFLKEGSGEIIGKNDTVLVNFSVKLYSGLVGGTSSYTEVFNDYKGVKVINGEFTVQLGRGKASGDLQKLLSSHKSLFAELSAEGEVLGPRLSLSAAPYAYSAGVQTIYGVVNPTNSTVNAPIGTIYVNRTDNNATWKRIDNGWKKLD